MSLALSDQDRRELITLHMPMTVRTFNKLLDAVLAEWPDAFPVTYDDDPAVVHVMSTPTLVGCGAQSAPMISPCQRCTVTSM